MEPCDEELTDVGGSIRELLDQQSGRRERMDAARRGFLEKAALRDRRRMPRLVWAGGALGAVGAIAVLLFAVNSPITFKVGPSRAAGSTDDVVAAGAGQPVLLDFSEGSSVRVAPMGRVRVLDTAANGARVLVERGAVDVAVAHRVVGPTRWQFELGPFHVLVTGTKFRAGWNPASQSFALAMQEGSVQVSGDCLKSPRRVVSGERLDLSCPAAPLDAPPPSVAAGTAPALDPNAGSVSPPAVPSTRVERELDPVGWRWLLESGRLRDALRAAEGAGFERVCRIATAKELLDLSDAARLTGKPNRAIEALSTLRKRFPYSSDAANAAFALGKVAFEHQHAYDEAVRWFATYLNEQPNGFLMGDAVGRLMEARYRSGDTVGARADAERYLRRFPGGPYTREALSIRARR